MLGCNPGGWKTRATCHWRRYDLHCLTCIDISSDAKNKCIQMDLSTSNLGSITFLYFLLHNCMQIVLLRQRKKLCSLF